MLPALPLEGPERLRRRDPLLERSPRVYRALDRKVSDTGYPPRDWRGVHLLLWEEHHGSVPPGHAVVFKNGNKADIRIENLELITRRELMARNTVHNLPKPLAQLVQLRGALVRKINRLNQTKEEFI